MPARSITRVARRTGLWFGLLVAGCDGGSTAPDVAIARVDIAGVPADNVVLVGGTAQLTAVPRDAGGAAVSRSITWSSTDAAIARVSSTGLVTAVAPGVVVIAAAAGGQTAEVAIDVRVALSVPAAGAGSAVTASFFDNTLRLTVPPGASTLAALTVGRGVVITNDSRLLTNTAFTIGPAGVTFGTPLTAEVSVNLAGIAASKRPGLRLFRVTTETGLEPIGASAVDLGRGVVLAPLSRTGSYLVVAPGDVAQLTSTDGNSRRVDVGTAVPGIGVQARDAAGNPVPGVSILFRVQGTVGRIVGDSIALTGTDGVARLPGQWIAGPSKGLYRLLASVVGAPLAVPFEATAVTTATAVKIRSAPTAGRSGVRFTDPLLVELVDGAGDRVEVTQPVSIALVGTGGTLGGTTTETAVNGGAIFQGQQINGGGTFRIVASSAGLAPDTTAPITITQEVASLHVITEPAGAVSGVAFTTQPVVELRDAAGFRVVGGTTAVTAQVSGGGTLFGTRTVAAVDGRVTFTNLAIEGPGLVQLVFTAPLATNGFSRDFTVAPPPPGIRLLVGATPVRDATVGQSFGVALTLDFANRDGADIGSLDVTLTWDPARFEFEMPIAGSWRDGAGAASTVTVDVSQVAAGRLRFTGSAPNATTTNFQLGLGILRTLPTSVTVESLVAATITSARNAAGGDVAVRVLPMTVRISAP
ncbi:MAG: Ig-like domain-containing protein [Gemmatimonadaceae bacterium]|nr:Ig-like domain-containing protein [Gemmatimonadaceae bacterium]